MFIFIYVCIHVCMSVLRRCSRETASVGHVLHDVVVWACHTASSRALHHLVCAGYLGVLDSTHRVITASLVPRRVLSAQKRTRPRTAAVCYRTVLCTEILRVRSADTRSDGYADTRSDGHADTRSDGHARADQRRRHQPAYARADVRAVVGAELCRPDG